MKSILLLILLLLTVDVSAKNWPQFRGPQASGVDTNAAAPVKWNVEAGENIRWHTSIPGLGHSCPVIWEKQIYITTADQKEKADLKVGLYGDIESSIDVGPQEWRLLALDKETGKILWNKLGHRSVPRVRRHPKGSHCSSTPATDGRLIVAILGSEGLYCFDKEGGLVWKKDLGPMDSGYYQVPTAQWGFASSPIIHGDKVIVLCDVQTNSFVAVFELKTGKELWRTARADVPTWGSPTVAQAGEQEIILVNGWRHTGAYDLATGKEIWRLKGGGDIPVPTPIVANGLAYFTSAHGQFRPMRAIRLDAKGDITPPKVGETNAAIRWAYDRRGNYMQTPIVVGDHLFGCVDFGVLTCFNAKTGEVRYSERLGNGSEGFTASPVSDGRHLYVTSEEGNIYVVPVNETFSVTATNKMGESCMATPALCDGTIFFRTRDQLVAVGK